jgi:bifunctional non-homologous end joining protein LigD
VSLDGERGPSVSDPFAGLAPDERALLREAPLPGFSEPMKATLTDDRFSDGNWIFERKLDGIRSLGIRGDGEVQLYSRNDLSQNTRYPELVDALQAEDQQQFVVDGEIVAFTGSRTDFGKLTQRHRLGPERVRVFYYVFDVLYLAGHDTTALPQRARKAVLRRALRFHGNVRYTTHRNRDGEAFYAYACAHGWEGLIAKRADAPYVHARSRDWLKLKCAAEQELVIGGFTEPKGSRTVLGALLVGYYDDGRLRYAGKVGTGFDRAMLQDLGERLAPLRRGDSPFADEVRERAVTWVEPELVAQIGFSEWTADGRLRHPRFLGLRDDKPAREVVRERA